jgi:hypothetical protein
MNLKEQHAQKLTEMFNSDNASNDEIENLRNQLGMAKKQNSEYEDQLQVRINK